MQMKKLLAVFFLTGFLLNGATAQTEVSGEQSGTWDASGSPYLVIGEVIVPTGQSLNIEPGVEVNFQGHYKFTVKGTLNAVGTEADSIFFTTDNPSVGWGGIRFENSPFISHLSYCRIEFGKTEGDYPDNHGGGMALIASDAVVSNCVFADNDATGEEDGMGGAVYAINTGNLSTPLTKFTNCKFLRNHAFGEGGAIKFSADINTEITGCEFIENNCKYGGGAISFYSVTGTKMIFCLFAGNYTQYSAGGAVNTLGMANSIAFKNCTITGNSAPGGDGGGVNLAYAVADFVNTIVYNNPGMYSSNLNLDFEGYAAVNYCDMPVPSGATGSNNINQDPQFLNPGDYDFHLAETSPCIDAGTDIGYEYIGQAPDMGCFEYGSNVGIFNPQTKNIKVYPNPVKDILFLDFAGDKTATLEIFNPAGQMVRQMQEVHSSGSINLSNLKPGLYYLFIKTKTNTSSVKIIKE